MQSSLCRPGEPVSTLLTTMRQFARRMTPIRPFSYTVTPLSYRPAPYFMPSPHARMPTSAVHCRYKHSLPIDQSQATSRLPLGKIEGRVLLHFRCKPCGGMVTKTASKHAYEKGVVLIQCPHCDNRHLIADNLNWFGEGKQNIETILEQKGEVVTRQLDLKDPAAWPEGIKEFLGESGGETVK